MKKLEKETQEILETLAEELSSSHLVDDEEEEEVVSLYAGSFRISWPASAIHEAE